MKELKDLHVQNIVYKMRELKDELFSQPDLWYGGLPPVLHQIDNYIDGQLLQLTTVFDVQNQDRPEA